MKKFIKTCSILALSMIIIGVIMASVISLIKGGNFLNHYLEDATGGRIRSSLNEIWYDIRDSNVISSNQEYITEGILSPGESIFSGEHHIYEGDVTSTINQDGIESLCINVGGCRLEILESKEDVFYFETKDASKLQVYVEDNVLYLADINTSHVGGWGDAGILGDDWKNHKLYLYIPEGYVFEEINIDVGAGSMKASVLEGKEMTLCLGAGSMEVDAVTAENLIAEVGAGSMKLRNVTADTLQAQVDAGNFSAKGEIKEEIGVECNAGMASLSLQGVKQDYNYELTGALGSIVLDGKEYAGMGYEKEIDNHADKDMMLNCAVGSIVVEFK